jgi:anti-sigma B factor antagonist
MEVNTYTQGDVTILEVTGDVDGSTAPTLQEHVLAVAQPGCRLLLNMERIDFMSSAGLRIMLLLHRRISGGIGKVVLVGLSESIRDTMTATGFLKFFATADTLEDGLQVLDQS